ncbi:MAG TPA: nickel pincer cofactor biosynthesis protein LarB [Candidatus Limnocylindria bacterium]|jgi:NCAIR mutase (PurE)-related protein|nr:nickel pincer cofactor biosynthesis protein LarB [Candidatus Limnocylindria bacterium]
MDTSAVARLDHERHDRTGVPEVVFAAGKTLEQNLALLRGLYERAGFALATRVPADQRAPLVAALPEAAFEPLSGALRCGRLARTGEQVAVVCAGTSDLPVAEEAAFTLDAFGHETVRATDVGVAGIHRLFERIDAIAAARAVIVVAGMEGALPSVVAGLVRTPVIAVPTSVGYGAAFEGLAALLGMLNACAPGIAVVNIDNGFGAAAFAHKVIGEAR